MLDVGIELVLTVSPMWAWKLKRWAGQNVVGYSPNRRCLSRAGSRFSTAPSSTSRPALLEASRLSSADR